MVSETIFPPSSDKRVTGLGLPELRELDLSDAGFGYPSRKTACGLPCYQRSVGPQIRISCCGDPTKAFSPDASLGVPGACQSVCTPGKSFTESAWWSSVPSRFQRAIRFGLAPVLSKFAERCRVHRSFADSVETLRSLRRAVGHLIE